ncbi:hypothetical protein [Niabella aurantiaca]|uniref:hypothetical protein n=1 Tax=Niabella aurantiaca TaxID=379900 RepID=UPI000371B24B|nr:hypothetical protein [Niabella aurantiaca]
MKIKTAYQIGPDRQIVIPREALCRTYGTVITFDETLKVHYETDVAQLGTIEEEGYLFFLNRKQVYINNRAPYLLADRLSDTLGSVLYPLLLLVRFDGVFEQLINQEDLVERWKQERPGIARYYKGAIPENAIVQMDRLLQGEEHLKEALKKDWFCNIFFAGIQGKRAFSYKQEVEMEFPLIPYGPMVRYRAKGDLAARNTGSKTFVINYKGAPEEERTVADILNRRPVPMERHLYGTGAPATGLLDLTYHIYHRDHSMRSIRATVVLDSKGADERTVVFETYHQADADRVLTDAVEVAVPVKTEKKKRSGIF